MEEFTNGLKAVTFILGGLMGIFTTIQNAVDGVFYALVACVVVDYITGVITAIATKKWDKDIGLRGIAKKILIFVIVCLGIILDAEVLQRGSILQTSFSMFYISTELISIIENYDKMGLPIPKKLKKFIEEIRKDDE
jgi:toxin secretion/phage lysis holin